MRYTFTKFSPYFTCNRRIIQIRIDEHIAFSRFQDFNLHVLNSGLLHDQGLFHPFTDCQNTLFNLCSIAKFYFPDLECFPCKSSERSRLCSCVLISRHIFSGFSELILKQCHCFHSIIFRQIIISYHTRFITGCIFIKVYYTVYIIIRTHQSSLLPDIAKAYTWDSTDSELFDHIYKIHVMIAPSVNCNNCSVRPHDLCQISDSFCCIDLVITYFRYPVYDNPRIFQIFCFRKFCCYRTSVVV